MPKNKTKFSAALKEAYPFLKADPKNECGGICTICKVSFSVANKGKTGIEIHMQTSHHKKAAQASIENRSVAEFFPSTYNENVDLKVAAKELAFAYHTAKHGLSMASADCNSRMVSSMFEPKFSCGKTKTAAIIKNVGG